MRQSLGPHTLLSEPHQTHHVWLTKFDANQRHQIIQEDLDARTGVFRVMAGVLACGIILVLISLFAIFSN